MHCPNIKSTYFISLSIISSHRFIFSCFCLYSYFLKMCQEKYVCRRLIQSNNIFCEVLYVKNRPFAVHSPCIYCTLPYTYIYCTYIFNFSNKYLFIMMLHNIWYFPQCIHFVHTWRTAAQNEECNYSLVDLQILVQKGGWVWFPYK